MKKSDNFADKHRFCNLGNNKIVKESNMNILFLAYEVESIPMLEVSKLYLSEGNNQTYILNGDFWTYVNNSNFYSRHYNSSNCTFYNNFEDEYIALNKESESVNANLEYLRNFEKTYSLSLNEIIMTDPILFTASHDRDYFHISPANIKLKWIELVIRKCLKIFDEFRPDIILTVSNNYFVKNLIYHIAKSKGIPFINTMNARVKDIFIATDNLSLNTSRHFLDTMEKIGDKHKAEAGILIKNIYENNVSSYSTHEELIKKFKANTLFQDIKRVVSVNFVSAYITVFKKKHYRGYFTPNYLGAMFFPSLLNNIRNSIFKKHFLIKKINFQKNLPENLRFYYFTLHVIPESTILTQSDDYKEESVIKDICAKLPIDTFLVVKENFQMLGERQMSFYKNLLQIHNLILIDPYFNSLELVKKSLGVISMAGTVSFEACILNKRAILVGKPEYSALSMMEKYNKYTTDFNDSVYVKPGNNISDYIQSVLELGVPLNFNYLIQHGEWNNVNKDDYKAEIKKLKEMYDNYMHVKVLLI